jgi:hypothetical protein
MVNSMVENVSIDEIIKPLKAEIQSVARSKRFIDWQESGSFSASLGHILYEVERNILPHHPQQAIKILDSFLALGERVMIRCDDSNGDISGSFREAVDMWGRAWSLLPDFNGQTLAESIWKYFEVNDYGLLDEVIPSTADALKRKGLDELEALVKNKYRGGDDFKTFHALRDIAVVRQSPEAFFEVFKFTGRKEHVSDQIDRARLLIQSNRKSEAITLLESIDDTEHYGRDSLDLLIDLYSDENDIGKAQKLRWRGFMTRSDLKYYHAYIEHAQTSTDKEHARNEALVFAKSHSNPLTAIDLLHGLECAEEAACQLREAYDRLDGRFYPTLLTLSKLFLKANFPLEAILIYRRLAEDILSRAQSKYYHHAINYLKKEKKLTIKVNDWKSHPETEAYFAELASLHAKKPAFMRLFYEM